MECRGLAKTWENIESIRTRVRETQDLFTLPAGAKWLEPSRINAVAHTDVLVPSLLVLKGTQPCKLPYLNDLQLELVNFYDEVLGKHDDKVVFRNAQELKRLLGLIKRKAQKAKSNIAELTKDHTHTLLYHVFDFLGRSYTRIW